MIFLDIGTFAVINALEAFPMDGFTLFCSFYRLGVACVLFGIVKGQPFEPNCSLVTRHVSGAMAAVPRRTK